MEYDMILQKTEEVSGLSKEEIQRRILEKQQELSNLISREGAALIIARELGLDLMHKPAHKTLSIKDIIPDMRTINIKARIMKIFDTREFERNGKKGRVANIIVADETGNLRFSLWDSQIMLLQGIEEGNAVEIFGAYVKENPRGLEIRLGKRGGVRVIGDSEVPEIETIKRSAERASINDVREEGEYELRGTVVQLFDNNPFYEVCQQCGGRVKKAPTGFLCQKHGNVSPAQTVILSGVIDDGTGNIRAVFFRDAALGLMGMNIADALEHGNKLLENIDVIGKEYVLRGRAKRNKMFNRLEFVVDEAMVADPKAEAERMLS